MTLGLFAKLAWRNVLRNKRRTLIAGIAVALGLAALMFVDALQIAMKENMIDVATSSFLGEGQIAHGDFRQAQEIRQTIQHHEEIISRLKDDARVKSFTPRVLSFAMLASPSNVGSVQMVGIQPSTEQYISQIDDNIIAGKYFAGDDSHDIVIGAKLAELLEVEVGDRVVMTAAEAYSGRLAQELYRVSGIFRFGMPELDRYMAFVRISQAQEMLNLDNEVHQIALNFYNRDLGQYRDALFWQEYDGRGNEAVGWVDLVPQLERVFQLSRVARIIITVILFGVVALGIVNTLFMSLYERMFEFGVLRAVGTRPYAMARLIMLEAAALAVISIILGCLFGALTLGITSLTGIDFTGIEYEGVTFTKMLYPVWHIQQFTLYPLGFLLFTALVALYPAIYAARLTPVKAMRKSI